MVTCGRRVSTGMATHADEQGIGLVVLTGRKLYFQSAFLRTETRLDRLGVP